MMRKKFLMFLVLEVLLTLAVIIIFKTIEDRSIAGVIAGSLFLSFGFFIIYSLTQTKFYMRAFSFYGALVHLGMGAIPLLATRLMNWGIPHEELLILGVPAPIFHKIAEKIFVILILCTLVDLIKTFIPVRTQV